MSISIRSNIASLKAQRLLNTASEELSKTFQRLSSGQRINTASDDPAGLAIATSLNVSNRVFTQSIRNVNDGISALNITDGAIEQLTSINMRHKELATQAATGTLGSAQRAAINTEAQALRNEFNRIVSTTSFNGVKLLDPATGDIRIEAGSTADSAALYIGTSNLAVGAKGDGTFASRQDFGVGSAPLSVTTDDFNQDGIIDIATSDNSSSSVSILIGNGDGTFKAKTSLATTSSAVYGITKGDVNGDGLQDIAVAVFTGGGGNIFLSNGDGTFKAAVSYAGTVGDQGALLADLNGDGKADLVLGSTNLEVFIGNGDGSFKANVSYVTLGPASPTSTVSGDFNRDGKLDLATVGSNSQSVGILIGNGDGTFKSFVSYVSGANIGASLGAVATSDLNGDGLLDLVTADTAAGTTSVLFGNGDGTFKAKTAYTAGAGTGSVFLADFNGDGSVDIVTSDSTDGTLSILLNNGNGTFKARSTLQTSTAPHVVTGADFNGDGATDLVAVEGGNNSAGVFLGTAVSTSYLNTLDLSNRSGAYAALRMLSTVSDRLGLDVGRLGGQMSRLNVAASTLQTTRENYASAASRILDVDVASESSNLARNQILQQAGASVLAQANQQPTIALQLLRG